MESHKAKPVHDWREFLTEIGIIVIGVLIALGAEQVVETLHWREKVASTQVALSQEVAGNRFRAEERMAIADCLDRRLDQLEARVRDASGRLEPEPYWLSREMLAGPPYRTPIRPWGDAVWQAANADGTAVHMARERMLAYAGAYEEIAMIRAENAREFDRTSALGVLQRGVTLGPGDKLHLLEVLEELRRDNNLIALQAGQVLDVLRPTGLPKASQRLNAETSATYKTCRDLRLIG